jgi:hypothetical protein
MALGDITPGFEILIARREKAVKQQLAVYVRNLNHLELQAAQYGLDIPTPLLSKIKYNREQIYHLVRELSRQEGILPVLEAISQGKSSGMLQEL